jgi:peptide/nickel transport system ATP-binding protein
MLLEVENLTVDIPVAGGFVHAVRGVSFHVARGEIYAIVGESGSGKSLTALALMNLLPRCARRSAARLSFQSVDLLTLPERHMEDLRGSRMAMVFQDSLAALNPCFTIGAQLTETLIRHRRTSKAAARDRAVSLLEKVGVAAASSRMRQYPHQLSGGQRQRAMIAMALMCNPDLIIADEPTSALDAVTQAQILKLFADLRQEFGVGIVFITHDLGVVGALADRVGVIYAGRIVESGPTGPLFANPRHPYTQALLSSALTPGRTR